MSERTFEMSSPGPVVLGVELAAGEIDVDIRPEVSTAYVVLSTADDTGPAADAVNAARSVEDGRLFSVQVPNVPTGSVTQTVHMSGVQNVSIVHGNVGGTVIVNGQVVGGGAQLNVSPIRARVVLPSGSSLAAVTKSAGLCTRGALDRVEFRSTSGGCDIQAVRELTAATTSGDVFAGPVTGTVTAKSVSGDILVADFGGTDGSLTTTSGDVRVTAAPSAAGRLHASTVSGDIRVPRSLNATTRSVSGRIRAMA